MGDKDAIKKLCKERRFYRPNPFDGYELMIRDIINTRLGILMECAHEIEERKRSHWGDNNLINEYCRTLNNVLSDLNAFRLRHWYWRPLSLL